MIFLAVLLLAYVATWLLSRSLPSSRDRWRTALSAAMVIAGVSHLIDPAPFIQHLPVGVPARELLVAGSGVAEIGFGVALLTSRLDRALVGIALAAFLVAVFPANVYVAVAGVDVDGQPGGIYPWVRLGFQPLFVWLAISCTRHTSVPAAAARPSPLAPTDVEERGQREERRRLRPSLPTLVRPSEPLPRDNRQEQA